MILAVLFGSALLLSVAIGQEVIGNVAFSAAFKHDVTIEHSQIVVYPDVFTNQGGAYNPATGIFTAPKGGIYVFHIHALATFDSEFSLDIYKNEQYMVSAYGRLIGDYASGGNALTLKLVKNDTVHVKTRLTVSLYGREDDVYATFTGCMTGITKPRT